MEILTYIISGELEHQDTMGNREKIRSGELQRMSAGKGVRHSEFNSLPHQECHLLQIWVLPEKNGIDPGYEQKSFTTELGRKDLVLVASREGAEGSISLNQDIKLYLSKQRKQEELLLPLHSQRKGWIQLVSGEVTISSGKTPDGAVRLSAGDGCAISEEGALRALCSHDAEFLFFDLP
jgi:redox-sensitive bicupin YhaK (pirin superfamily)